MEGEFKFTFRAGALTKAEGPTLTLTATATATDAGGVTGVAVATPVFAGG